ncbi:MAG: Reversal of tor2 lethality [Thelocarpon impressellum]|nr:MAG: Reversal of tor2 lethality [Thelocarpon impressellum]
MPHLLRSLLLAGTVLTATVSAAAIDPKLTGTWSTKSNKVFTGPGFYDPVNEKMLEPSLPGISYSFTDDGFYEEAHYRAIGNPAKPQCPQGIMQFQHGTFKKASNGSLLLSPFEVDGRQLLSSPCQYDTSLYTRYKQPEMFARYEVITDPYHNVQRLNLYKFDGSPMIPMYLAFKPPQMLPTVTMNPTATATGSTQSTGSGKSKRNFEEIPWPLNHQVMSKRRAPIDADKWWWVGVGMTGLGAVGYLCF